MDDESDDASHECRYCYPVTLRLLMKCLQCVTCYYYWDDHRLSRSMQNGFDNFGFWYFAVTTSDLFTVFAITFTLFLFITVRQSCSSWLWRSTDYIFTGISAAGFVMLLMLHLTWVLSSSYDSLVVATIAKESPQVVLAIVAMFVLDNRLAARDLSVDMTCSKKNIASTSQIRV